MSINHNNFLKFKSYNLFGATYNFLLFDWGLSFILLIGDQLAFASAVDKRRSF